MNLNMKHGVNPDTIIRVVIIVFFIALFVFICFVEPFAYGELDDYSFPVASILNTHNFAIEPSDIEYYRTLFPDFAELTESYSLSGFNTLDGTGELTWYFPVYSLVCVPLTVLFKLIHVKTVFAFQFTNYLFWLGSVLFVWYGYSIGNHLFMFMSVAIILVHCYQIWYRIKESRSAKKIAKAEQRAANAEAKVDEQKIQLQNLMNGQNQPEENQINSNDSKL